MGQNILGSKEKENVKSTTQEWYLEGPLLRSGMCTKVFEFVWHAPPASLSRPTHSISEEQTRKNGKQENKSLSSMVVSVLVDGDGVISPNSICRIFFVVLIDSVRYVTYSCMLPFKESAPLVN
ncbi:hypothetical protein EJD97_014874, partial [Solanum chilense]